MYLFLDTETTGFFSEKHPLNHQIQPYLVQVGAVLDDEEGNTRSSLDFIIDNKIDIPVGASNIHGITREVAAKFGIPPMAAVQALAQLATRANLIVCHNVAFDKTIIEIAIIRLGYEMRALNDKRWFCTKEASTSLAKIPGSRGGYKWPTLDEA